MGGKPRRRLTHFDGAGRAHMVEVGKKRETARVAVASGAIIMAEATARRIDEGAIGKGDVLGVARLAGIQAVKRTPDLIPLAHPLRISGIDIAFDVSVAEARVGVTATVRAFDRTGVEMEAFAAVTVALLTIYDMCKAIDRGMQLTGIRLDYKAGGKSGTWRRTA